MTKECTTTAPVCLAKRYSTKKTWKELAGSSLDSGCLAAADFKILEALLTLRFMNNGKELAKAGEEEDSFKKDRRKKGQGSMV